MYSKTIIVGRVGRDAETRFTSEGVQVTSFSVAVDVGYGQNKTTQWYKVAAWRKLAEVCAEYVTKGMLILVDGTVKADAYVGQDGQARANLEINARDVKFLSRRDEAGYDGSQNDDVPF